MLDIEFGGNCMFSDFMVGLDDFLDVLFFFSVEIDFDGGFWVELFDCG